MKIRWKKFLIFCTLQGAYSLALIAATFYVAYSQSQCARVNPDGTMDVFIGEVCRQKWRGN